MVKEAGYLKIPTLSQERKILMARYGQLGLTKLHRWPCLVLGNPPRQGYYRRRQFCGAVAALLGKRTTPSRLSSLPPLGSPWMMVMETTSLESFSICSKLKLRQVIAIKLNYIVVFAAILSLQSNLGADQRGQQGVHLTKVIGHLTRGRLQLDCP